MSQWLAILRALEEENHRLKRMYADNQMQNELLKEVLEKKELQ